MAFTKVIKVALVILFGFFILSLFFGRKASATVADSFQFPLDSNFYHNSGYDFLDQVVEFLPRFLLHVGEDWNFKFGQDLNHPVYSVANGTVITSDSFGGCLGNTILIEHVAPSGSKFTLPGGRGESKVWFLHPTGVVERKRR